MEENFLHLTPLSFRVLEHGKHICVETSGLSMRMCVLCESWRQELAITVNLLISLFPLSLWGHSIHS